MYPRWATKYRDDAVEFSGKTLKELAQMAKDYPEVCYPRFDVRDPKKYYIDIGLYQLARSLAFHMFPAGVDAAGRVFECFNPGNPAKVLDYYCGSAIIGFEMALRGHEVTLIDVPSSAADNFNRWRAKKYPEAKIDFELGEGYEAVLLLDAIEHMEPDTLEEELANIVGRMPEKGGLLTNFFFNQNFDNPEHIMMDKARTYVAFDRLGLRQLGAMLFAKLPREEVQDA